jgi:P-type Cu2+ transporter
MGEVNLITKNHHNEDDHHGHMIMDFKKRFYISFVLTIPVLILSPLIQGLFGLNLNFEGSKVISWFISLIIYIYGGWPFIIGFFKELKERNLGMMTLIALAISVAYFYSTAVVFGLEGELFLWELATLVDIMLLGHWIEMSSVSRAFNSIKKIAMLLPNTVHLIENNQVKDVGIDQIQNGNNILVRAGEKIPADGVIIHGSAYIDESMLTGESVPVEKAEGDKVIGGSINADSVIRIKVTGTGKDSYLNKVIQLVRDAQISKSKTQKLADKAAKWLTYLAIVTGILTFTYWSFSEKEISFAIERAATVMVITCPHALGLAIPLVNAVSTSLAAKNGLLIRNRTAFENSRNITTILFDKTGTLTKGVFGVASIEIINNKFKENEILKLAASLENNSEHPIGKAIVKKAKIKNLDLYQAKKVNILKGSGISGEVENKQIMLVSRKKVEELELTVPAHRKKLIGTQVYILINNEIAALMILSDEIRKQSHSAISELKQAGIKCLMITGDNQHTARQVAQKLKLDGYFAEVLPHEKQNKVKELQNQNEFVAMIGDGINDAPSLAQADVGIAIGSGTDIAAQTADIILVNNNLEDISTLISFGKTTYKKMVQNLFLAFGYNLFAIPLAAGVLYRFGILVSPAIGAGLMTLSTIVVSVNARLLSLNKNLLKVSTNVS